MEKIEVTKGTNMIPLVFNITDFQIPKTASATAYITGASGKTKKKLCDVVGNRITLEPTSDLFSVGNNDIQIRIVDETKTLVTFNTNCYCEKSVEFGDAAEEKEQTLIEQLLASQGKIQTGLNNEVEERKKQAKNLEDNKLDKTGDASDTTIDFTESLNRENIASGEKARTMFGKISKWFSDIREAAFAKVANNLDTTEEGYVLDARQGKKLKEDITELNSKIEGNITSVQNYVKIMGDSYVEKVGNKVSLQIVAQSSSAFASGTKYHIADIPAEFRPKRLELTAAFANSSSTTGYGVAYMEIDVTGAINVQFATQAKNLFGHLEYFL